MISDLIILNVFIFNSTNIVVIIIRAWVQSQSVMSNSVCDPWTAAHQAPLSMGFSRQEYWRGLPCPPLGDPPDPWIEPESLTFPALAGGFSTMGSSSNNRNNSKNRIKYLWYTSCQAQPWVSYVRSALGSPNGLRERKWHSRASSQMGTEVLWLAQVDTDSKGRPQDKVPWWIHCCLSHSLMKNSWVSYNHWCHSFDPRDHHTKSF